MTRRHKRYYVLFPMQYDTAAQAPHYAISRNISSSGLLMATAQQLAVDAPVKLTIKLPGSSEERTFEGKIVRVNVNDQDPQGMWPFTAAIEFANVDEALDPILREAQARSEFPPPHDPA